MTMTQAHALFVVILSILSLGQAQRAIAEPTERVVYLAGNLSPEQVVTLAAGVSANDRPGVLLLYPGGGNSATQDVVVALRPARVIAVGDVQDRQEFETRLGPERVTHVPWKDGQPERLWPLLFDRPERVVVCPAEPRGQLLQAACLAGVARAPLFISRGGAEEIAELKQWVRKWQPRTLQAVGSDAARLCRRIRDVQTTVLADESAVATAHRRLLRQRGRIGNLVVANPSDFDRRSGMSPLAPWIALQRNAALVHTRPAGDDVEPAVQAALKERGLGEADALLLVGGLDAIPMQRRPNPQPSEKDPFIEMEPFTPTRTEPCTFATGRLFHDDPGVVTRVLARQQLLAESDGPRRALVASNAGGGLPLMETISRNTVQELRNAGYTTTTLIGKDATRESLRRSLPQADVFLWEGHHNTLIRDWAFPEWTEPLPPSFVFLQSCLALHQWKAQPLFSRGAVAVLGTSTRVYSASGGACSLAFFDALLYEDRSLGAALRQSKNFLLCYALLKEKRLGKDAQRTGANLRSAWTFTLWGDPTLKLPAPPRPAGALEPVRHEVEGNRIVVKLPPSAHHPVYGNRFRTEMLPNARLAGLVKKEDSDDGKPLLPFVFAEVSLPKAPAGRVPRLSSRLPSRYWVFTWDARRRCGCLLVTPRSSDDDELRFNVHWDAVQTASGATTAAVGQ